MPNENSLISACLADQKNDKTRQYDIVFDKRIQTNFPLSNRLIKAMAATLEMHSAARNY